MGHHHDRYGLRIDFLHINKTGTMKMRFLQREMFIKKTNTKRIITRTKK